MTDQTPNHPALNNATAVRDDIIETAARLAVGVERDPKPFARWFSALPVDVAAAVETYAYIGRDGLDESGMTPWEEFMAEREHLGTVTPTHVENAAWRLAEKFPLAEYLRSGLKIAKAHGITFDEVRTMQRTHQPLPDEVS